MSHSNSLRAYTDCEKLFQSALADPKGARACLGTYEACMQLRGRMNYFRTLDRKANAETYDRGHPMHGASIYDPYIVQILEDEEHEFWLYIQPREANILVIEGLSSLDDNVTDTESHEVHQLEDHSNGKA